MDDRSIIAILVGAIKNLWSNVAALMQSDEAQNARIQQLEEEVAALKSRSAAAREHTHTPTSLSAANFPHKASSCANAELIELFTLDYSRHRIVDQSTSAINGPRRLRGGLQTADIKYVGGAA